jgi:CRISPR-associated exonuclease Cas4
MRSSSGLFSEDDLLPLSGLQHMAFCERQWALIHIEQQWEENHLTAAGRVLHEHVHESGSEGRKTLLVVRGLPLQNLRLGISGQADAVEFRATNLSDPGGVASGVTLEGKPGRWLPSPVEYKRGKPKKQNCDLVQVCAQALCLEEMFAIAIPAGALFYATPRRRQEVAFTPQLRAQTERLCARMHHLYARRETPPPVYTKGCENCSLKNICLPRTLAAPRDVQAYLAAAMKAGDTKE